MTPRVPPPDLAPLIAALTGHLRRLDDLDLPPPAARILAQARADLAALAASVEGADRNTGASAPIVDRGTFDALLSLAGPQVAPALLRQLSADLAQVAARLGPALAGQDRAQVRAQSHVLMALAGSVGAKALYTAAERLNRAAHAEADAGDDGARVLAGLAELRRFIDDAAQPAATEGQT